MQLCRHKTLVCEAKASLRPERRLKALEVGLWHSKEDTLERYAHHVVYVTHVKLESGNQNQLMKQLRKRNLLSDF